MCAVNPVCPVDPVCQAVLPSAAGSYSTDYNNKGNLQCTHWHTFSLAFPQSGTISSSRLTLVSLPPNLSCFNLTQLNTLLNILFPSVSFHYRLLLLFSLCSFFFNLCHLGYVPKFPVITHPLSASASFSSHFHCPLYQSRLSALTINVSLSLLSFWDPAQILQMLLCTGWGPIQQCDKSIQRENYVMCHHIDWPSLLILPPRVFSSSTSYSVIDSPCVTSICWLFTPI